MNTKMPPLTKAISIYAILHGAACLLLRPFLFFVAPYEASQTVGSIFFLLVSLCFVVFGALALQGKGWPLLALGLLFASASLQYISQEFAYSNMGPFFVKLGSGPMTPQPWINVNVLGSIATIIAFKSYFSIPKDNNTSADVTENV
jgi:hypothetical protein